jgi:hypothetical protein
MPTADNLCPRRGPVDDLLRGAKRRNRYTMRLVTIGDNSQPTNTYFLRVNVDSVSPKSSSPVLRLVVLIRCVSPLTVMVPLETERTPSASNHSKSNDQSALFGV